MPGRGSEIHTRASHAPIMRIHAGILLVLMSKKSKAQSILNDSDSLLDLDRSIMNQAKWRYLLRPSGMTYTREPEWACRPSDLTPPRTSSNASSYTLVFAAYELTPNSKDRDNSLDFIFQKWPGASRSTEIYLHCKSPIERCRVPLELLECNANIGCSLHKLRNVGRESHVYMHHLSSLLLRNTSIPTMTFFTQENELGDLDKYLFDAIDGVLDTSIWFVAGRSAACYGGAECGRNFCWRGQDLAPAMNKIFSILGRTCPSAPFACGHRGSFGVHRNSILGHKRETYSALLALTEDSRPGPTVLGCDGPNKIYKLSSAKEAATWFGHAFERLWPAIFGVGTAAAQCTNDTLDPERSEATTPTFHGEPYYPPIVCRDEKLRDPLELALTRLRADKARLPIEKESRFRQAVRKALMSTSSCVPEGAIMVSVANEQHRKLRNLAFSNFLSSDPSTTNQGACLLARFVSLCFGFTDRIGTSVQAWPFVAAGFDSPSYHLMTWIKWHVLRITSIEATHTFFVDADVLVFQNPWPALMHAAASVPGYDVLFQVEALCDACASYCPNIGSSFVANDSIVCEPRQTVSLINGKHRLCPMNGGQLLVAQNSRLVRRVLQQQPCFHAGSRDDFPLDQFISDAVRSHNMPNLRTCALPSTFASHCWWLPRVRSRCELVSWHAACNFGSQKFKLMSDIMNRWNTSCAEGRWSPAAVAAAVVAAPPSATMASPPPKLRRWELRERYAMRVRRFSSRQRQRQQGSPSSPSKQPPLA